MKRRQAPLRFGHRFRGAQSLTEMALITPVVFMMVLGTLDFGRLFYMEVALANAAREGARAASQSAATSQQNGNAAVARTAYCELPSFHWNFTPPAVATPCAYANWSNWNPDPYDYSYNPPPSDPTAGLAYIYIAEDLNFPGDVPGPNPAPNWDSTQPSTNGKRLGGHLPVLVQIDYFWQPMTPLIGRFFPNGLVHVQVQAQQMEEY